MMPQLNVPEIFANMAKTFTERQAQYKDNWAMVGKMMAVLFPDGVPPSLVTQDQFHLFELILVKISRYATSQLTHQDSIHDAAVYAAMCEAINQLQSAGALTPKPVLSKDQVHVKEPHWRYGYADPKKENS